MFDAIYFDMDGTVADLYGVDGWLDSLRNEDTSPYEKAKPLTNMEHLNNLCEKFKKLGITIGVITWTAMNGKDAYNQAVKKVKRQWIKKYLPSVSEFYAVDYGTPKQSVSNYKNAILVDDNEKVRNDWNGKTINARDTRNMVQELEALLEELCK